MKKVFICITAVLLSTIISQAEVKKVIIAADPWLPFVDPGNAKGGISIEVIRAALATQGYEVKYENVPWTRADAGVNDGTYDILPDVWMTDARKKTQIYSDSYAVNRIKFVKKKGDKFEYNGLGSLSGKNVGIVRGYSYTDAFTSASNFKRDPVEDVMQNIQKLLAGRIDLTLDDEIVITAFIKSKNPKLLNEIEFTNNALSTNQLYISCGKKNPKCKDIIAAFNSGLKKIKADGTLGRIFSSYGLK